jgi:hypothetical protein
VALGGELLRSPFAGLHELVDRAMEPRLRV